DDAVFLLQTRPASQTDVRAALYGVSSHVVVLLDDDDRRSIFGCLDGCGESHRARAEDDDVRRFVPALRTLSALRSCRTNSAPRGGADANGRVLDEIPSREIGLL